MPLPKSEQFVLRKLECGWSCTVMPSSTTVTWSTLAGRYMTRWATKHKFGPTLLVAQKTVFNFTRFWFASSKVKCGWSVWLRYKACFITENLVRDWSFSQVALRWASSFSANDHSLGCALCVIYVMFPSLHLSITWLIICRDIVWNVPLFRHYRTELCLWLWIRSMTLPCRPSDYWHLCYSQYSPSSTLLQYMIDKASYLNCNTSHINCPFQQDLFLPWWRDFFYFVSTAD